MFVGVCVVRCVEYELVVVRMETVRLVWTSKLWEATWPAGLRCRVDGLESYHGVC